MAQVYLPGGSTYQNVAPTPTHQVTERIQTGTSYKPAFSFFGIPFGQKAVPKYENVTKTVPLTTPVSSYGVNNTGRTLPFNPNPSMPDYRSVDNGKGTGSVSWAGESSGSDDYGGGLLSLLFGHSRKKQEQQPYEAALRERPGDVQNLVSMTRNPSFGAPVDPNSAFNRQRG